MYAVAKFVNRKTGLSPSIPPLYLIKLIITVGVFC